MLKIGIITIIDFKNIGNRLQNYAIQYYLKCLGVEAITLINYPRKNDRKLYFLRNLKYYFSKIKNVFLKKKYPTERYVFFNNFNKNINISKNVITAFNISKINYDYYIVGSDQIWNPDLGGLRDVDLLVNIAKNKRISYAASISRNSISKEASVKAGNEWKNFKSISVREDSAKKIIEELTGRTDVEVLIDPTMLLTPEEWDKVSKKPKMLKEGKYVLNYFLGNLSQQRKEAIDKFAKEHDCYVINILDKKSPFYVCGPSEFLYLEKYAEMIFTDSFHSSVFAILYNRPFVIFDREQRGTENMGSRLDTLLSKFELKNRRYNGKEITKENYEHDYTRAYEILELERQKSRKFLEKALDIEQK